MNARMVMTGIVCMVLLSGCTTIKKAKRADELKYELAGLQDRTDKMLREKDAEIARLKAEKSAEKTEKESIRNQAMADLENTKGELQRRLEKELGEYKAKLEMTERGLVITFLAEVFFDSGLDKIRSDGEAALEKISDVLGSQVDNAYIAVEGHTDNDPIVKSGWKTNWELSSARALAVTHFLIDKAGIDPKRLSANGYGQYRPIADNSTKEGKQKNRRVEIVILPSKLKKVKDGM